MKTETCKNNFRIANICAFALMVLVNVLAVIIPLAGISTSQVSAMYPTLLTPAGFTFSIWSVIYVMVGVALILPFFIKSMAYDADLGPYFIISCALNILWLLTWHFQLVILSAVVIIALFLVLLKMYLMTRDNGFISKTAWSVYYAWITVAMMISVYVMIKTLAGGAPVTPIEPRSRVGVVREMIEPGTDVTVGKHPIYEMSEPRVMRTSEELEASDNLNAEYIAADTNYLNSENAVADASNSKLYNVKPLKLLASATGETIGDGTLDEIYGDLMLIKASQAVEDSSDDELLAEGDAVPINMPYEDEDGNVIDPDDQSNAIIAAPIGSYEDTTDPRIIIVGGDPEIASYASTLEYIFATFAVVIIAVLTLVHIFKFGDIAYALTVIWALVGMGYKQFVAPKHPVALLVVIVVAIVTIIFAAVDQTIIEKKK